MSKSNRAESSCGRKADNTLLQLPNDVIGIAKNRLSSISSKFRAPAEIPQKSPDTPKQRSRASTLSYFRKPKSKSKGEGSESPNINGENKELSNNGSKPKFKRQISIDVAPSRPVSMISSPHRNNSVEQVESSNSFPGTSSQRFGFFNHHHETPSKSVHAEDGRKPAIESICLFPRLVFPVHSSAITNSSMIANSSQHLNSDSLERPRKKLSFREPEIVETKKSPAVSLRKAKLEMFAALSDVSEDKSDGVGSIQSLPVSGDDELESQAMRIVRTVGQAFEVCHKLSPDAQAEAASSSAACDISEQAALSISDKISEISDRPPIKKDVAVQPKGYDKSHNDLDDGHQLHLLTLEPPPKAAHAQPNRLQRPTHLDVDVSLATARINQQPQVQAQSREPTPGYTDRSIMTTPQATEHREKFLEQSLEQQRQQTRAATAQLAMLNDQLVVEKAARVEAQARTHQLLLHNKELIDHISMLVAHLQERERGGAGSLPYSLSGHQLTNLPQAQSLRDVMEKSVPPDGRVPRLLHSPANLVLDNRSLLDSMSSLLPPLSPSLIVPRSPREAAYENNNNSSLASASTDSPGGFPGPYNYTYSLHQSEPIPSPMARRYNNMTSLTSAAAYLDQQNANDLTDFLIDLVNQQSPNSPQLPQNQHLQQQAVNSQLQQQAVNSQLQQQAVNSQLQQQALNRLSLYSGQSSPLQQRHINSGTSSDHLFPGANQQSPNLPRQLSADMRHSHSFLNTSAIQQEPMLSPREEEECQFIRPLSQIGTITTLDEEGRVRIVVPTKKSPQPIITRTTSERVPNKNNVLMAQVRDQWGRHTTK